MFDIKDVIKELEAVVAEAGEGRVYKPNPHPESTRRVPRSTTCWYVHADAVGERVPGCIAGQVLHRLGVSLEQLQEAENVACDVIPWVKVNLTDAASVVLRDAQMVQDGGFTWGEALASAKRLAVS